MTKSKHKTRFLNPHDGKYRSHSQVHKDKTKYDRKRNQRLKEMEINYRTPCCSASFYRKGRADFRCENCHKDVSLELLFLAQAVWDEEE